MGRIEVRQAERPHPGLEDLSQRFDQELKALEENLNMPYVSIVREIGERNGASHRFLIGRIGRNTGG